jgi:hypothetical protein
MGPGFFFLLFFGAIFIYLLVLVRNFIVKERASKARLNAQFTLLNSDLEKIKENIDRKKTKETDLHHAKSQPVTLYPPEKDRVIKKVVQEPKEVENYNFAIHLHEHAEQFLGPELFQGFENRVASIPGVENCTLQDSHIFLIQAANHTQELLTELFWREFLHAAELAHLQK